MILIGTAGPVLEHFQSGWLKACIAAADAWSMDAADPDNKIQAVVSLVLQAVDQRLALVREQLLHVTDTIAHNHAELSRRIDDCQRLGEAAMHASTHGPGASAATGQLVQAANILTERVEFLEARVNQYTNDRIAEVTALIERVSGGASTPAPAPTAAPRTAAVAPAVARVAPFGAVVAVPVAVPVAAHAPALAEQPIDIALLSAQMSERLAAAVDRALGAMPDNVRIPADNA